ncbi:hypothetical protein N431DRAFT_324908 [Stipitochalara longipes BDJ]|nr:hypothetical protein N431DRAFT_324908 [Stipitochalara longipes BDJ]
MASEEPTSDATAAIQPLLEDFTLTDPLPTFTFFPKLPPELRLKILEDALPVGLKGCRFIQVKARIGASSRHSSEPCWFILDDNACSSDVKDIGLLAANKECRHVFLRHFNKSLRSKGKGLIRYHEDDTIFISNIDALMRNPSIRSVIIAGSRLEHLFCSCTNIAAPIAYFMLCHENHARWFGPAAHICPLKVLSRFKKLKTAAAILSQSDIAKYADQLEMPPAVIQARWWCYLSHGEMEMKACMDAAKAGSGKTAPQLVLLSDEGEIMEGKKCTEKKCFNE